MPLSNQQLFDISTRKAALTENVKQYEYGLLAVALFEIRKALESYLDDLSVGNVGDMSKSKLTSLLVSLRASQGVLWASYITDLLDRIKAFTAVDLDVTREVYATAFATDDNGDEILSDEQIAFVIDSIAETDATITPLYGAKVADDAERLWTTIINAPMPANGVFMVSFVRGFAVSAQTASENAIRAAWANNTSVAALRDILFRRTLQGAGGQFQRSVLQGRAVISTAIQHATTVTQAAVQSSLAGMYQWHSVLDNSTSKICLDLNGRRFRYGAGPLPPAHVACRSHIAPIVGTGPVEVDRTFNAFARRQTQEFQDAIGQPMTLEEYRNTTRLILNRPVDDSTN